MTLQSESTCAPSVLVVDDEPHIVQVLALVFARGGWSVTSCSNGVQALARGRLVRPDLVITDHHMPGLTGLELARQLRRLPNISPTVIMLTSRSVGLDQQILKAAGVEEVITKPFSPRGLLQRARTMTSRRLSAEAA